METSKDELEGEINDAIESIRFTVLSLQLKIKATDQYVLGLLMSWPMITELNGHQGKTEVIILPYSQRCLGATY